MNSQVGKSLFLGLTPEKLKAVVLTILDENRQKIARLLKQEIVDFTFENLMQPLELMHDNLSQAWGKLNYLQSVSQSLNWRDAYNQCLEKVSCYQTELLQNLPLYQRIESFSKQSNFNLLDKAKQEVVLHYLREFQLAGVALSSEMKSRFLKLELELEKNEAKFDQNLIDSTQSWTFIEKDMSRLAGLSSYILDQAKQEAKRRQKEGWVITLQSSICHEILSACHHRDTRKKVYQAYCTRASDLAKSGLKAWDNTDVMQAILLARSAMARLLGFEDFVSYTLSTRMAKNAEEVLAFLDDILAYAKPKAEKEWSHLCHFAKEKGVEVLEPWDVAYYEARFKEAQGVVSQEVLRLYFALPKVLSELFKVVKRLFGLSITCELAQDAWHQDVFYVNIFDDQGRLRGGCYMDLYARDGKQQGAWVDSCRTRRRQFECQPLQDTTPLQTPIAYLTCNFSPQIDNKVSQLTHEDVVTLFHEFGHALHHIMTLVDHADLSGMNGVAWDFVELPSQLLENWAFEESVIMAMAVHSETGEALPKNWIEGIIKSRYFHSGMKLVKQIEFAYFDFLLHQSNHRQSSVDIQLLLDRVRDKVAVCPIWDKNRFQHGFSHIFSGGYAAGYYSYLWADRLACDVFSTFKERGVFDSMTGRRFLNCVLEQGGVEDPHEMLQKFYGRSPNSKAFLRHYHLTD